MFPSSFRETEQGGRNQVKKHLPGWAVLLIITLAAGLALGGTYALTKDPIDQQALIAAENARKAALPDAESFEELTLDEGASVDWAFAGLKEGNTVGYVAQKTVNGFGGKVEVIAGVDTSKAPDTFTIGGISVGGSSFSETAGLGARSKEPAFTDQFAGKIYPISFIKAGGTPTDSTVDALTSATITTTAVVNGVNDIVKYIKADVMGIAGVEMPAKPADGVFSASEKGFRGPVYVEAAFDAAGKVTYMKVGDENFAEDIGAGVVEPDFMYQFIGKQMPLEVADIDVISGATISSTAVVKALNNAYAIAGGAEIVVPETPTMPEKPAEGVFSAAEKGFAGPVYVEAAFDEDGKITYLGVGDDQFAETDGFGARALEPEEQYPFIGKQMPLEIGDVDALTGATFTKTAIVNGLNKAYAASKGEVIEEPVQEEVTLPEKPAEGVYSAAEKGFAGPVYVEAAFDGEGKVSYISVGDDQFAETQGFGANALLPENQAAFIGKQMPLELSDVDVLTGATFTKTAIVNGLNKAYAASKGEATEEPAAADTETSGKPAVTFSADAFGFQSDVFVEAAFEDGKITWISIGDKRFDETAGLGARVLEPEFQAQFIGKAVPIALTDIDAISGATFTSTAVVEAINKAYEKSLAAGTAEPAAAASEGAYAASAQGFGGPVAVEASFDADGKITSIKIGDDQFAETTGLGAKALEADFQAQFIGKQMPLALSDIDAIAGATVTSTAVVDALNAAYEKSQSAGTAEAAIATYTQEIIAGSAVSKLTVTFENDALTALTLSDSDKEAAMQEKFIGAELPVSVMEDDIYTFAVAAAIRNAYNQYREEYPNASSASVEIAEEPAEEKSAAPAFKDVRHSVGISSLTSDIQVKVSFVQNTVAGLVVMDRPAGSDKAYSISELDTEMKDRFLAATLPLNVADMETSEAALVANAINAAYYAQGGAVKPKPAAAQTEEATATEQPTAEIIGGADAPTAIIVTQPGSEDDWYTCEVLCFFTAIQVDARFKDGRVDALVISDKQAGIDTEYAPSSQQDAMAVLFVGAPLPLDTNQTTPYASAVAIAINQAFGQSGQTPAQAGDAAAAAGDEWAGQSTTVMFFTQYTVWAEFDGNTLTHFSVYTAPAGPSVPVHEMEEFDASALEQVLAGREMPLNEADFTESIGGLPTYTVSAIVIAINQAYAQDAPGQQ